MDDYADIVNAGESEIRRLLERHADEFSNELDLLHQMGNGPSARNVKTAARNTLASLLQLATAFRYVSSDPIDEVVDEIIAARGRPRGWLQFLPAVSLEVIGAGIPRANLSLEDALDLADEELPRFLPGA